MCPKSNRTGVLMRKGVDTQSQTETEGRRPCDSRARDWSDTATSQGAPTSARNYEKVGRGKEECFSRAVRGSVTLMTP